ncbi:hypothetical protein [Prevotella sp. kh1p2]|uniref:hypothetical protein n=1 Tax=Prevotella sp. kh1p2 TaxID=1761883 RepID=UPI00115FE542|nr:hypothetical protein [Prevotella sp. kh1p2]
MDIINRFFVFYPPIHYLTQQENYSVTLSLTPNSNAAASNQQRKNYSVTLSLNRSNKAVGNCQQLKEYSVTLSLTRNSKCTASNQQQKNYSVTLSFNPISSEKTIQLLCLQSSGANQRVTSCSGSSPWKGEVR